MAATVTITISLNAPALTVAQDAANRIAEDARLAVAKSVGGLYAVSSTVAIA